MLSQSLTEVKSTKQVILPIQTQHTKKHHPPRDHVRIGAHERERGSAQTQAICLLLSTAAAADGWPRHRLASHVQAPAARLLRCRLKDVGAVGVEGAQVQQVRLCALESSASHVGECGRAAE